MYQLWNATGLVNEISLTDLYHQYSWLTNYSDEVAEWLRRWTANPMGSARVGSNPILVAYLFFIFWKKICWFDKMLINLLHQVLCSEIILN